MYDKWRHLISGIPLGLLLTLVGVYFFVAPWSIALPLLAVVGISIGFELFSLFSGYGHYELMDAVYSIIGGVLGVAMGWLLWPFI